MTVQSMHDEFKVTLDKVDSSAYPELLDWEIDFFLNEAQERFIKNRYGKNNLYSAGFEENQKRKEDLSSIIVSAYCAIVTTNYPMLAGGSVVKAELTNFWEDAAKTLPLEYKYMFFGKALAETSKANCPSKWNSVRELQHGEITPMLSDPFHKPMASDPVIFFEDGDIFITAGESASVDNLFLTFVRRPESINIGSYEGSEQECVLSEHTHKEIVQYAVKIAMESIESPRLQSFQAANINKVE